MTFKRRFFFLLSQNDRCTQSTQIRIGGPVDGGEKKSFKIVHFVLFTLIFALERRAHAKGSE